MPTELVDFAQLQATGGVQHRDDLLQYKRREVGHAAILLCAALCTPSSAGAPFKAQPLRLRAVPHRLQQSDHCALCEVLLRDASAALPQTNRNMSQSVNLNQPEPRTRYGAMTETTTAGCSKHLNNVELDPVEHSQAWIAPT